MFWWAFLDRADAWVETPEVQMVTGLFYLSLIVGFGMVWVWQKLR